MPARRAARQQRRRRPARPTFGQTVDCRIARLILEKDEVIDGASRRRPGGKLIPVDPDYASSAPFSDLCGGTADARARYQQRLAPGECGIFDDTQPGGEIGDTDGKADLPKNSPSMLSVPQAKPSPDYEYRISLRPHPVGHPSLAGRSRPRYESGATGIGKLENDGGRPEAISEIARLRRVDARVSNAKLLSIGDLRPFPSDPLRNKPFKNSPIGQGSFQLCRSRPYPVSETDKFGR
jgi:hypothetical protein